MVSGKAWVVMVVVSEAHLFTRKKTWWVVMRGVGGTPPQKQLAPSLIDLYLSIPGAAGS